MTGFIEQLAARLWNRASRERPSVRGITLGVEVSDGQVTARSVRLPDTVRTEHVAIIGKTGTGKTSLVKHMLAQDIRQGKGFACIDFHGDLTPFILSAVRTLESRHASDLSQRLIVIDPADSTHSVGLNPLESGHQRVDTVIADIVAILKDRWQLERFGPRTEELLRNSLHVLADNNLTLIELTPLLTNQAYRTGLITHTTNPEVRAFFEQRYDRRSEALQGVMREAVLNKVTAFTANIAFRHMIGQQQAAFRLTNCMDSGAWVIISLHKAQLGDEVYTLASLFLSAFKHALFARQSRRLFTIYADEIQNVAAHDGELETFVSEARKFGVGVCSAHQYLEQLTPALRAALLSVGTHVLFRLAASDAAFLAWALDGRRALSELLKNLPSRHVLVKSGDRGFQHAVVPPVALKQVNYSDLLSRCRARWAVPREDIESSIDSRQPAHAVSSGDLDGWE